MVVFFHHALLQRRDLYHPWFRGCGADHPVGGLLGGDRGDPRLRDARWPNQHLRQQDGEKELIILEVYISSELGRI